ncbi:MULTISPECIES: hypothetical protein [unclassified Achromobacter]|uniref:hypothetical protein n=1 Tax=unclassified Achromobacter TaxID=2626865 RepID=UPI001E61A5FB|nr:MULTISPECIES: hypothetical protein [unclassified Achromobacter]
MASISSKIAHPEHATVREHGPGPSIKPSEKMATVSHPFIPAHPAHSLVIVEGIMGSGKSTTMRFVAKRLEACGFVALPIHERTDPHPVRATDELENWFEPWKDATPQHLATRALARWAAFVEATRNGSAIPILDGQLFHGDLTHLLLMEAGSALLSDYVKALAAIMAPLDPLVIYLWQEDIEKAVRTVCTERGAEWIEYQVNWKLKGPYCIRRGYQGLHGLIALYRDYRGATDDLFDQLPLAKLAIENSAGDWPAYESRILAALSLPAGP